jgi:hypothetical protein
MGVLEILLSTSRIEPTVWLDAPPLAISTPIPQLLMERPERVHAYTSMSDLRES